MKFLQAFLLYQIAPNLFTFESICKANNHLLNEYSRSLVTNSCKDCKTNLAGILKSPPLSRWVSFGVDSKLTYR
jgi:hypothetical protein